MSVKQAITDQRVPVKIRTADADASRVKERKTP